MQNIKIYTFWQGYMPPYIRMCLDTFPNSGHEFVVLDHSNVNDYLSPRDFPLEKLAKIPPAAQGDIIACYMMNRFRGYFIDADTIFLGKITHLEELLYSHELVMIGDEKVPFCHAAFILSSGDSVILREWETKIRNLLAAKENSDQAGSQDDGGFLINSNSFGHPLLHPIIGKRMDRVKILDKDLFLPENRCLRDFSSEKRCQSYNEFYFTEEAKDIHDAPFLILHNSWSPGWYKDYRKEKVEKDGLFISRLLMQAAPKI